MSIAIYRAFAFGNFHPILRSLRPPISRSHFGETRLEFLLQTLWRYRAHEGIFVNT